MKSIHVNEQLYLTLLNGHTVGGSRFLTLALTAAPLCTALLNGKSIRIKLRYWLPSLFLLVLRFSCARQGLQFVTLVRYMIYARKFRASYCTKASFQGTVLASLTA